MTKVWGVSALGTLALIGGCGEPPSKRAPLQDQALTPDADGWVDGSLTGTTRIQGQWRGWLPLTAPPIPVGVEAGTCPPSAEYGECSFVIEPAADESYSPTAGLGMCASGVISPWIFGSTDAVPFTADGQPGRAGLVFDLNLPARPSAPEAGDLQASAARPYDAQDQGVTGFAFDIDSEPGALLRFRVELTSEGAGTVPNETPAYWQGSAHEDASPVHAGHNEFRWDDVGPSPLYANGLLSIGFVVSGNESQTVNYDFCIDNLTALRSASGASVTPPLAGQPLAADETGWVSRETTGSTQIQGRWYAFSDIETCRSADHADDACSMIVEPDPASPDFAPIPGLGPCTSGVAARVVDGPDDGAVPDHESIWGGGIGLSLNENGDEGARPYDAWSYGVTGFAFDIDSEPPPQSGLRVELVTVETRNAPAWWGGDAVSSSPVHAGHNEFRWNEVGGPRWLLDDNPPADPPDFDPQTLTELQFHVPSNDTRAVTYAFCIKNLTALLD